jgi:thiamine biosynthesis lipoprotein
MMHRHEFNAMGCKMLAISDSKQNPPDLEMVPQWFEEWERSLSRFRIDSELSQFNLHAGLPIKVSQTLWDVFMASVEAERVTGGLINPLILNALINAGYDQGFDLLQQDSASSFPEFEAVVPSLKAVKTDPSTHTICIPEGAQLDFGGVAKGWAAHQVMERLKVDGPSLVNAGGDIAISGLNSNREAWPIGIEDPFQPDKDFEILFIEEGGIATSGRDYRHWTRNGRNFHHIIDPNTGQPAETDILTATVIAPTVMQAEAIAKAVFISGSRVGLSWLDSDETLAGLFVLENGDRIDSKNLSRFI